MPPGPKIGPPSRHVIETTVDGDISLFNSSNESVTILNGTASDIWMLCDGDHSLDEIVDLLARSYEVDPAEIRPGVENTVVRLTKSNLFAR